jgi:Transposase DDE domain
MTEEFSEWAIVKKLLPPGWREKARELGAFKKPTYTKDPEELLRALLFYAANDGGSRDAVAQLAAAGIVHMSGVALLKRLDSAYEYLRWIASALNAELRADRGPEAWSLRPRIVDGSSVCALGKKGARWRVHYTLDLLTLDCDWHEVTESLTLVPVKPGDVLIGDRNFLTHEGARAVTQAAGHVLARIRWSHPRMTLATGERAEALKLARKLRPGEVGEWLVHMTDPTEPDQPAIPGRIVALRLPLPLAQKAAKRRARTAARKSRSKRTDPRSIEACNYVFVFTTLPRDQLAKEKVLELYRHRWQVELAFKRLKQILELGRLPHKVPTHARSWIQAKLVVALLLEKLHRNAMHFSPWGYSLETKPA